MVQLKRSRNLLTVLHYLPAEKVWCAPGKGSAYAPIRSLIEADEEESVLYHTLYRFLCLFGRPDVDGCAADSVCKSTAWRAIRGWLDSPRGKSQFHKVGQCLQLDASF